MTQLFCEKCVRFLADRYVRRCPRCGYDDARGDHVTSAVSSTTLSSSSSHDASSARPPLSRRIRNTCSFASMSSSH